MPSGLTTFYVFFGDGCVFRVQAMSLSKENMNLGSPAPPSQHSLEKATAPADFSDPITMELMSDPVTLMDLQSP